MRKMIAAALLLAAVPALAAPTVEVATGDWDGLPIIQARDNRFVPGNTVDKIHKVIAKGECELPRQTKRRLDLTVPFLLHFQPDGTLDRVVVRKLDCPAIESLLGGMLLGLVSGGNYRASGENPDGWYRSQISISTEA